MQVTTADGGFSFQGLPAGVFELEASQLLDDPGAPTQRTTLQGVNAGTSDLEMVLAPASSVAGHVYGPDGEPWARVSVVAKDPNGETVWIERTAADGFFQIALEAGESVDLLVYRPYDGDTPQFVQNMNSLEPALTAKAVSSGTTDLELRASD